MSIADRIISMSNNLSNAYDGIEYLGVDTTGVDKNLQNLSSMLNVVYEGLPKVSDEGTSPSLDGTRVGRLKSTLKASDTTQESTTGKNLFNKTDYTTISIGNNGYATSTKTIDKITITTGAGSVSSGVYITKANLIDYINNYDSANTYYVSMDIKANRNITMQIGCDTRPSNIQVGTALSRISVETKIVNNGLIIYSTMNNEGDTIEVTNIMVSTSQDTSYEPYTGGIPSPSPTFPQSIHTIKGNNTVEVCGKNLFDKNNVNSLQVFLNYSNKITPGSEGSLTFYISCKGNTTYTISKKELFGNDRFCVFDTADLPAIGITALGYSGMRSGENTDTSLTLTTSNTAKYLCIFIRASNTAPNASISELAGSIQVEIGAEPTTYEPYTGITLPINLPTGMELCKIGDYQDKLFKAISGDTVYNTLTSEQKAGLVSGGWYKYADYGKAILNGTEYWTTESQGKGYGVTLINLYRVTQASAITTAICNQYNSGSLNSMRANSTDFCTYGDNAYFNKYDMTLEEFKTHIGNNNLVVYYQLATPTTTQITDTTLISQLNALYNAMSYNGQTNILQTNADLPFIISASALKGA